MLLLQALILAAIFAVPLSLLLALIWTKSGEQCPEREPDGPPMDALDGALLNEWAKTNKWGTS